MCNTFYFTLKRSFKASNIVWFVAADKDAGESVDSGLNSQPKPRAQQSEEEAS